MVPEFVAPVVGTIAGCSGALVLFWAAQSKVATFGDFVDTVQATMSLSMPRSTAKAVAALVVLLEVVAVIACLTPALSGLAALLVAGLGVLFAAAGAMALIKGEPIVCNCFGRSSTGRDRQLGWLQVALLPAWLLLALLIAGPRSAGSPVAETVILLVVLTAALLRAVIPAVRLLRDLRHERLLFN